MKVVINTGGIASTNAFLIADETTGKAVIFDAPDHTVGPLLDEAQRQKWDVVGLWLTHGHFDHVADHGRVTERFPGARVLIHRLDEPKLLRPNATFFALPFSIAPRAADDYVSDGTKLDLGSLAVECIHTPGHSPGHVMYHFPSKQVLVGGDLIICGAVGRTDFPDSDPAALDESIRRVMQLPPDTLLLPGHCGATTLASERDENPYVRRVLSSRTVSAPR